MRRGPTLCSVCKAVYSVMTALNPVAVGSCFGRLGHLSREEMAAAGAEEFAVVDEALVQLNKWQEASAASMVQSQTNKKHVFARVANKWKQEKLAATPAWGPATGAQLRAAMSVYADSDSEEASKGYRQGPARREEEGQRQGGIVRHGPGTCGEGDSFCQGRQSSSGWRIPAGQEGGCRRLYMQVGLHRGSCPAFLHPWGWVIVCFLFAS